MRAYRNKETKMQVSFQNYVFPSGKKASAVKKPGIFYHSKITTVDPTHNCCGMCLRDHIFPVYIVIPQREEGAKLLLGYYY
jgi:hypothetical protein